jgi:WD40 repeat protein/serine/threonine protein kinase
LGQHRLGGSFAAEDLMADSSPERPLGAAGETTSAFTPTPADGPGPRRLGDYRILRELGRGGMGIVYEAEQESLGRHVALKVLPPGALIEPKALQRFQREAKAAARLHHTNIVPVYGFGQEGDLHYYVMQLIPGQGLHEVIAEVARLRQAEAGSTSPTTATALPARSLWDGAATPTSPEGDAGSTAPPRNGPSVTAALSETRTAYWRGVARVGLQAAQALHYAHTQSVLHRDVKPSNLLLDTAGTVWVADFGLAKAAESEGLTHSGDIIGTLRYMAPERFRGECDARADVYGLGLTLYELVALRPAFAAADRQRLIHEVMHGVPVPPRRLDAAIPRDLETIILKASAREAMDRYATAAALAEDLQRYQEDRPLLARRASARERLWRWCRRNPALAASTAAAAVLLLVVTAVSVLFAAAQKAAADREAENATILSEQKEATLDALNTSEQRGRELGEANRRAGEVLRDSAQLALGRGLELAEKGEANPGLLWMARGLAIAPNDATDLQRYIRLSLDTWGWQAHAVHEVIPHAGFWARSPDGGVLLVAQERGFSLWDLGAARRRCRVATEGPLLDAKFSGDGRGVLTVVSDPRHDRSIFQLRDVATGAARGSPLHFSRGFHDLVALNHDGGTAMVQGRPLQGRTQLQLWDLKTGRPVGEPWQPSPNRLLSDLRFTADGMLVEPQGGWYVIRDAKTGKPGTELRHPQNSYPTVLLSPDARRVLSIWTELVWKGPRGEWIQHARLWDAAAGKSVAEITCPGSQPDRSPVASFSRDGVLLALATAADGDAAIPPALGAVRFWDASTGRPRGGPFLHGGAVDGIDFSPDARTLLTVSGGEVRLWDIASGRPKGSALVHPAGVAWVTFSPDGGRVVTGSGNQVRLWETATGRAQGEPLLLPGPVRRVGFSGDGQKVWASGDSETRFWEAFPPSRQIGAPCPVRGSLLTAEISPDNRVAVVANHSRQFGAAVQRWDLARGERIGEVLTSWMLREGATPALGGGRFMQVEPLQKVEVRDPASGRALSPPTTIPELHLRPPALSPGGRLFVTHGQPFSSEELHLRLWALRVWETATGKQLMAIRPWPENGQFAVGDRLLATAEKDVIRLWECATGKNSVSEMHAGGTVVCVALSPDECRLLVVTDRGSRLWDTATGEPRAELATPPGANGRAWFAADGKTVLTELSSNARRGPASLQRWDARTGKLLSSWPDEPPPRFTVAAGGRLVAVDAGPGPPGQRGNWQMYSGGDGRALLEEYPAETFQLWRADTGKAVAPPLVRESPTWCETSPELRFLLTGDGPDLRLWEAATGQPHGPPLHHSEDVQAALFSPDGRALLTVTKKHAVHLWETATAQLLTESRAHREALTHLGFSPDGKVFWTGAGKQVRLGDGRTGKPLVKQPLALNEPLQAAWVSPDGKTLVTHCQGMGLSEVRLWEAATGKPIGKPLPPTSSLPSWPPFLNEGVIVTQEQEQGPPPRVGMRLWSASTGEPLGPVIPHPLGADAALSRDGKRLRMTSQAWPAPLLQEWEVAGGKPVGSPLQVLAGHKDDTAVAISSGTRVQARRPKDQDAASPSELIVGGVNQVVFGPGGDRAILVTTNPDGSGALRLWATDSGKTLAGPMPVFAPNVRPDFNPFVHAVFSPRGDVVAVAGQAPQSRQWEVRLWEARTGKVRGRLECPGRIHGILFSPDGAVALVLHSDARDEQAAGRLIALGDGRVIGEPLGLPFTASSATFSPDGRLLLTLSTPRSVSSDQDRSEARLWETAGGKARDKPLEVAGRILAAGFNDGGKTIFAVTIEAQPRRRVVLRRWDAAAQGPGAEMSAYEANDPPQVVLSPDQRLAVTIDAGKGGPSTVRSWDTRTGMLLGKPLHTPEAIPQVFLSPDRRTLVLTHSPNLLWLCDVRTGETLQTFRHSAFQPPRAGFATDSTAITFSPDGRLLLVQNAYLETQMSEIRGLHGRGHAMTLEARTGKILARWKDLAAAELSSDGRTLLGVAQGTPESRHVQVYDAVTGQALGGHSTYHSQVKAGPRFGGPTEPVFLFPDKPVALTIQARTVLQPRSLETGRPTGAFMELPGAPTAHVFSPDGKLLVTACEREVQVWDVATGRPHSLPVQLPSAVVSLAFRPDGGGFLTVCQDRAPNTGQPPAERQVRLWTTAGVAVGEPIHFTGEAAVRFSPEGRMLLTHTRGSAFRLRDAFTGEDIRVPVLLREMAALHPNEVHLAYDTGRKRLAMCLQLRQEDRRPVRSEVRLWDVSKDRAVGAPFLIESVIVDLLFSPDGATLLALPSGGVIERLVSDTGKPLGPAWSQKAGGFLHGVSPSGRGAYILDVAQDIHLWDGFRGKKQKTVRIGGKPQVLAWSPDGSVGVCEVGGAYRLVEASGRFRGEPIPVGLPPNSSYPFTGARFSPDGKRFLILNGPMVYLGEVATGRRHAKPLQSDHPIRDAFFSPDGRGIITCARPQPAGGGMPEPGVFPATEVRLWDVATGEPRGPALPHDGLVFNALLRPGHNELLTLDRRQTHLWDLGTGKRIAALPCEGWTGVAAFSPDGSLLATAGQDGIRLWETDEGRRHGPVLPYSLASALAFSPDGGILLSGRRASRPVGGEEVRAEVCLWDVGTARQIGAPLPHPESVHRLAFSPDGRLFLSALESPGFRGPEASNGSVWFRHAPVPVEGGPERVALWAQVLTGAELAADGRVRILDAAEWRERKEKLGGEKSVGNRRTARAAARD